MLRRNYIIYIAIAFTTLSCGKKFLDKKPQGFVDENFYKTSDQIVSAVNAAYDPLGWEVDETGSDYANEWWIGDVCSDDAVKGGFGAGDFPTINQLETFTATPSNPTLGLLWTRYYVGIYRANLVIDKVPKSNAPQTLKDRIIGEAKFLRALYYQKLVNVFGAVPLVVGPLETDKLNLSRSPKSQVYAQIVADFKDAANALPEKGGIEKGRATKGAALALLARAYMYQTAPNDPDFPNASANWQNVFDACDAVIKSNKYSLEPKFEEIHSVAKEDGVESIFEIQNISGTPGYGNANEGTLMNVMYRGRKEGGWGFNRPSMDLVNEFEANDPRLKATVVSHGDVLFAGEDPYDNSEWFDLSKYPFTNKYGRKYVEPKTVLAGGQSDGPSNPRIIRYADVLLMYAEAANELGNSGEALAKLKIVRDRVKLPEVKETDKAKLRDLIWHERRVELALEHLRFFDLVRQGRAYEVMSKFSNEEGGGLFRKGINELFPIPETQIDLSNGSITQNPGYN